MASFKEIRELLLLSLENSTISDEEFLLLSEQFKSKNPDFPYENYLGFELDDMDESECLTEFVGLPGVLGNKGTLAKYSREQGNMSLFLGNWGTKLYKLEEENIVSKFITRGTNTENVLEHGKIGQFWKGTREQGTLLGDPRI